jgi:hypothetical protein
MLTTGWYDYKIVKRLRAGDILECQIDDPPSLMNIKVVRGGEGRG